MAIEFDGKGNIEATTDDGVIAVKLYSLEKTIEQKDKEIKRLNNIINNIENDLIDRYYGRGKYHLPTDIIGIPTFYRRIKELKGDGSNE